MVLKYSAQKITHRCTGALHHIIARGIDRSKIFKDPADKRIFLDRLADILKVTETHCYA